MERVLGNISFFGAIIIVFIGILIIIVKASPSSPQSEETALMMEHIMMVILAVSGVSTLIYVIKSRLGKGEPD